MVHTGDRISTLISGTDQTAQKHPYKYGQLIFAKFLRQFSEERMVFSTNCVDTIEYPYEKNEFQSYLTANTRMNSKLITGNFLGVQ